MNPKGKDTPPSKTPPPQNSVSVTLSAAFAFCVFLFRFRFLFLFFFSHFWFGFEFGSWFTIRSCPKLHPAFPLCALAAEQAACPSPAPMQGARCPSTMATVSPRSSRSFRTPCPWSPACVPVRMGAPLLCTHSLRASPEWHHSLCPELCLLAKCGWTCHMH